LFPEFLMTLEECCPLLFVASISAGNATVSHVIVDDFQQAADTTIPAKLQQQICDVAFFRRGR
jgi:hypothetical protein